MARRTPEEAEKWLRDAAKSTHKVGLLDRRIGDTQMKTPGYTAKPGLRMFEVDRSKLQPRGLQEVPLDKVQTQQHAVSVKKVAAKLRGNKGSVPEYILHKGVYYTNDGNHATTAARALGNTTIKGNVLELPHGPAANAQITKAATKAAPAVAKLPKGTGKAALIVAGATAATAALGILTSKAKAAEGTSGKGKEKESGDDHLAKAERVATNIATNVGTGIAVAGTAATAAISLASTGKMAQGAATKVASKAAARGPDGRFAKATAAVTKAAAKVEANQGALSKVNAALNNKTVVAAAKLSLPLFAVRAAYGAYTGYQKDGVKGAAKGVADVATMGVSSAVLDQLAPTEQRGPTPTMSQAVAKLTSIDGNAARSTPQGASPKPAAPPPPATTQGYTKVDGTPGKKDFTAKQIEAFKARIGKPQPG